jgi:hypothetical protein
MSNPLRPRQESRDERRGVDDDLVDRLETHRATA